MRSEGAKPTHTLPCCCRLMAAWGRCGRGRDSPVHAGPLRETPPPGFWRRAFLSSDPTVAEPGVRGGSDDPGDSAGVTPLPSASLLARSVGLSSWSGLGGLTMCGTVGTAKWTSDAEEVICDVPAEAGTAEGLISGWLGCLAGAGASTGAATGAAAGAALGMPA